MSPAQFAVLWVLNNAIVTSAIAGPRTIEQWQDYLGTFDHQFTAEDEELIDGLVVTGHPSTPGYKRSRLPHRRAASGWPKREKERVCQAN